MANTQADHQKTTQEAAIVPVERIENCIHVLRGEKIMLDSDLAALYNVKTEAINQAVKRNLNRFPDDFMFQITTEEKEFLTSQIVISKTGRGGRRTLPYAFTEQGVAMLSSVLRSEQAVHVNIEIMRAFVRMRAAISTNRDLARQIESLEKKYDAQFKSVFEAIRQLMLPPSSPTERIGFRKKVASSKGK